MKKQITLLLAMSKAFAAAALDFTVPNAEGVDISYHVRTDGVSLNVVAANYSGRVVIPDTVYYEGTAYVVTDIQKAFANTNVTYLHIPATVTQLSNGCFAGCDMLDTLSFETAEPIATHFDRPQNSFSYGYNLDSLVILVPCGSLADWHASWGNLANMRSDCAYQLVAISDDTSMYASKSIYYEETEPVGLEMAIEKNMNFKMLLGWFFADGSMFDCTEPYYLHHDDTLYIRTAETAYSPFGVNLVSSRVYVFGNMSYDGSNANYTIGQTEAATIYANGLWVGAKDGYAAAHTYMSLGNDYLPGPLLLASAGSVNHDVEIMLWYNRVWHLTREQIDYHIAHCGDAGYEPIADIATWPGNGPEGYAEQLAPYYDADSDGVYNPMAGDYPIIRGDECAFSIFNDGSALHGTSGGNALGLEIHCMTYTFNEPADSALWNTVFTHYDLFNRSARTYDSTYLGAWTDFDIGYGYDDYVGCDVRRGMYYGYNGKDVDGPGEGCFEGVPPAQSCTFLGGAWQQADGKDNGKVDIDYILYGSNQALIDLLEEYRTDGRLDTVAINRDADRFFAVDYHSWHFAVDDEVGNQAINGTGFGNGIIDDERIGMTSFIYYNNSYSGINADPTEYSDFYNYLRAQWKNGQHVRYGGSGLYGTDIDANFMWPDDSDPWHWGTNGIEPEMNPYDWNETTDGNFPSDRRGLASSGPFSFAPSGTREDGIGAWQQLDLAYTTAFGQDNAWGSVVALGMLTDEVRRQWQRDTTDSGKPFTYMPYSAPHEVAGISEAPRAELAIYPNPTTGMVYISVPRDAEMQIFDMVGHCVKVTHVQQGLVAVDLSGLPQGVYLVRAAGAASRIVKR